jgi:hypothetical protein
LFFNLFAIMAKTYKDGLIAIGGNRPAAGSDQAEAVEMTDTAAHLPAPGAADISTAPTAEAQDESSAAKLGSEPSAATAAATTAAPQATEPTATVLSLGRQLEATTSVANADHIAIENVPYLDAGHDRAQADTATGDEAEEGYDEGERLPPAELIEGGPALNTSSVGQGSAITVKQKLGIFVILFFVVGSTLITAAVGVLCFLWFAHDDNDLWRAINTRNWTTQAVTICAEVIKQAVSFQMGSIVAMTASLALEHRSVLFPHAAAYSMMKACASSGTAVMLLWYQLTAVFVIRSKTYSLLFVLVLVIGAVFGITQVFSILLVSDLGPGFVTGDSSTSKIAYGYDYTHRDYPLLAEAVGWARSAPAYPTFAEYSETASVADGVSDTGLTLRAFLPFADAVRRQTLRSYSGTTTVLDSRVTCQIPHFYNLTAGGTDQGVFLMGRVAPSKITPRLQNATHLDHLDSFVNFRCAVIAMDIDEWKLSFCQLALRPEQVVTDFTTVQTQFVNSSFLHPALASEFIDPATWISREREGDTNPYGAAYLVLNLTKGSFRDWSYTLPIFSSGRLPTALTPRDEWLDLSFKGLFNSSGTISTSLCYAAFGQADLSVHITSTANRTESFPTYDNATSKYTFDFLRNQYGQNVNSEATDRGILQLQKQNWVAFPTELASTSEAEDPYFRVYNGFLPPVGYHQQYGFNQSGYVTTAELVADDDGMQLNAMHVWLIQEILQTGGSLAFALQSIITLMAGMTYYDNLSNFNVTSDADLAFFTLAQIPLGFRGLIVVLATLLAHAVLSVVVMVLFLKGTRYARLGDSWAALAQCTGGEMDRYLADAGMKGDGLVQKEMKAAKEARRLVGVEERDGRVAVVGNPQVSEG